MGVISSSFPFTSSTSGAVWQKYTNSSKHYHLKTPRFQCRGPKSNPHPPLIPHCINPPSVPNSSCLLAPHFISLSVYRTTLPLSLSPLSLSPSLSHTHMHEQIRASPLAAASPPPSLSVSRSVSWVLEDLSKPRGRKSAFLPHQLAKPDVERAQLRAPLPLMLTANGDAPTAWHEGHWAPAKG